MANGDQLGGDAGDRIPQPAEQLGASFSSPEFYKELASLTDTSSKFEDADKLSSFMSTRGMGGENAALRAAAEGVNNIYGPQNSLAKTGIFRSIPA